jgi:hypothetical protein
LPDSVQIFEINNVKFIAIFDLDYSDYMQHLGFKRWKKAKWYARDLEFDLYIYNEKWDRYLD